MYSHDVVLVLATSALESFLDSESKLRKEGEDEGVKKLDGGVAKKILIDKLLTNLGIIGRS